MVDYLELPSARRWEWLQVEVSGLCNAACSYCALSCYKDEWEGGLMEEGTFERLVAEFRRADLVFLQGWGEPLLHPRLREMARLVKKAGALVGFTTNGTRLDQANLQNLLDMPIDILAVSIAGTTAATSDRWRPGNDFNCLDESLQQLRRIKTERDAGGPRVHIAYMLLASNWREIEALPAVAENWGASQVVVNNLSFICSTALEKESLFERPDLWGPALEALESAQRRAAELGIGLCYYRPDRLQPHPICTENVATGFVVGYPPCPHIEHFCDLIEKHHGLKVVIGTHPIPEKYFVTHQALGTWNSPQWQDSIKRVMEDEAVRLRYNGRHYDKHALRTMLVVHLSLFSSSAFTAGAFGKASHRRPEIAKYLPPFHQVAFTRLRQCVDSPCRPTVAGIPTRHHVTVFFQSP
jgi:hypothetical protein